MSNNSKEFILHGYKKRDWIEIFWEDFTNKSIQLIEKAVLVCSGIVEYIIKYIRTNPFTTLLLCCLTLPGSNSFCRKWCLIGFSVILPKSLFWLLVFPAGVVIMWRSNNKKTNKYGWKESLMVICCGNGVHLLSVQVLMNTLPDNI